MTAPGQCRAAACAPFCPVRKLATFALSFAAAVAFACGWAPRAWLVWLTGAGGVLTLAGLLVRGALRKRVMLVGLGAAMGFAWFLGWTAVCYAPARELAGTRQEAAATVVDYPKASALGIRVEVEVHRGGTGVKTLLYADEQYSSLQPGDSLALTARFKAADSIREEPAAFYSARGILLLAYAEQGITVTRPEKMPMRYWPVRWGRQLGECLSAVVPAQAASLLTAVTLGDTDELTGGLRSALSRAGLSHTVAVSGMHIGFLVMLLMTLCRRRQRWVAVTAIPCMVVYALVVGASPSVVRAVVMQSIVLLAPVLGRESDGPTSLGTALLVLLLQNPCAAASISLQLSFAAVAGIMLTTGPLLAWLKPLYEWEWAGIFWAGVHRMAWFFCGTLATTLGALLLTTPLTAFYFGAVSLAAPLSNLLSLWAVSGLFVGGLLAALIGLISVPLGTCLAVPAALLAKYVLWVAASLGALPFAAITMDSGYCRLWLLATYVILGAVFLFRREKPSPVLPVCGSVLMLCAALVLTNRTYTAAALTISALEVGQGAGTALYSGGASALIDCGGNGLDDAGDVAADYFQSLGVSRLDLLVLTHFDADHFNGVEELFARMEVSAVAAPKVEDVNGNRAELERLVLDEGARLWYITNLTTAAVGEAELTLYPPLGSGTTNEEGLLALCSAGNFDALITGDADSAVEAMLVKYYSIPDIEVLFVGHHGSAHSTSAEFLQAVRPETAIISSGYNTYGHPAQETLERLDAAGIALYRTDQQGTVTVTVRGEGIQTYGTETEGGSYRHEATEKGPEGRYAG